MTGHLKCMAYKWCKGGTKHKTFAAETLTKTKFGCRLRWQMALWWRLKWIDNMPKSDKRPVQMSQVTRATPFPTLFLSLPLSLFTCKSLVSPSCSFLSFPHSLSQFAWLDFSFAFCFITLRALPLSKSHHPSLSLSACLLFAWWATAKHIYKLLFAWPSTVALHFCSGSFHASSILLLLPILPLLAPFATLLIAVGQLCQPVWPVDWLATRSFVANVDCSSATAAAASTWTLTSIDWNSCSCQSAPPLAHFSSSHLSPTLSLSSSLYICFSLWLALAVNFYLDFTVSRFSYKFCNSCRALCPVFPLCLGQLPPSLNAIYNISSPFGFRSVQQPQLSEKKNAPLVNCAQFIMRALKAFVAIGRGNCRPTGGQLDWPGRVNGVGHGRYSFTIHHTPSRGCATKRVSQVRCLCDLEQEILVNESRSRMEVKVIEI